MTDRATRPELVLYAVTALRQFAGRLDRDRAAALLPMWRHYGSLSPADVAAVLDDFPTGGAS